MSEVSQQQKKINQAICKVRLNFTTDRQPHG